MNLHGRATGRALLSDADNITAAGSLLKSRLAHRTSREEIFTTIHALRNQGLTCSEIGRRTGFPRHSSAGWRRAEKQTKGPAVEHQIQEPVRNPETGHAISPVIAAALCIKPRGKLTSDQARKVDALKAGSPAFATMRSLAMRFNGILRGRQADPLPAWTCDAIETDLVPIMRFARTSHGHLDVNGWCSSHDAAPSVSGSEVRARMHDAARFRARSTSHTVAQAPYRAVSAVQNSACGGLGSGG